MSAADPHLIRYLLGELPPEEEAALDERGFVDDAWHEERAAAADDLIDAYLTGGLTADQRERFETRFLASSEHRERFRLLRDLRTVVEQNRSDVRAERSRDRARLAWALAAALVAALAAIVLLTSRSGSRDTRVAIGPTPVPARTPTPSLSTGTPTPVPAGTTAAVSLPERPQPTRIAIDSAVRVVRFTVPVRAEDTGPYVAQVRRDGRTVWEEGDLEASSGGATLVVDVPAQLLAGDSVTLALEPDATRSGSPRPPASARVWPLRLVRR